MKKDKRMKVEKKVDKNRRKNKINVNCRIKWQESEKGNKRNKKNVSRNWVKNKR